MSTATAPAVTTVTRLSKAMKRYVEMDKRYNEEIKKFFDDYKAAKDAVVLEIGVGGHFQDDEGTVYAPAICEGRFVHFDRWTIKRTRRQGEKRGDLSMDEARALGYKVEGK